jgi:hypothetical protein
MNFPAGVLGVVGLSRGTRAMVSSVAGFSTRIDSPLRAATCW